MSPRKRRHDEAFPHDEMIYKLVPYEEDGVSGDKEKADKEQEVWDAIREAHYEAVEQLPLTLHRQLSLMKQLDEQTVSFTARLLPTLQQYIKQRQAIAGASKHSEEAGGQSASMNSIQESHASGSTQSNGHLHEKSEATLTSPLRRVRNAEAHAPPRTPTPMSMPPERLKVPETTREILSHVAWMSEELLRASQEKVNLAQANYDSVERHVQLLDQAIKEQESALSLDPSRPTNGVSIHLPDLVVPKWHRNVRTAQSPDELDGLIDDQGISTTIEEPQKHSQRVSRKKGKDGLEKQKADNGEQGKDAISLTITLPATQPNEELYCYCNRVSFGEMIACDNTSCEREWFHLGCVGLTEPPEGEWFCEDCRVDET